MSKNTRNLFVWKARTEEGKKRQVEAKLFGGQWTLRARCDDEEEWTDYEEPLLDDLLILLEMLENKYQRKHLSYDKLQSVQKLIDDRAK
ncbi:MAG: hypothetical protein ACI841_003635 [Planctomycetota bacterium]|jgi:hypothetical protein